ncbi:MAG: hypothetical protein J5756_01465, partial [Clostridia bacterium]|nr:hypothetical protein [Clostridia bacterium]
MEKLRKSRMIALLTALTLALSIVFVPSAGAEQAKAEPLPVLAEQRVETPAADIPRPSAESEFIGVATVASYEDAAGG